MAKVNHSTCIMSRKQKLLFHLYYTKLARTLPDILSTLTLVAGGKELDLETIDMQAGALRPLLQDKLENGKF